jgi:hypothetical protein
MQDLHLQPPFQLLDGQVCQQIVIEGLDVEGGRYHLVIFHSFASLYSLQLRMRHVDFLFMLMTKKRITSRRPHFFILIRATKACVILKPKTLMGWNA